MIQLAEVRVTAGQEINANMGPYRWFRVMGQPALSTLLFKTQQNTSALSAWLPLSIRDIFRTRGELHTGVLLKSDVTGTVTLLWSDTDELDRAPQDDASILGSVTIAAPLGRRVDAQSGSVALSVEDVELLAPTFANVPWLALANRAGVLGAAYSITLVPPAWAVGVNFWVFCDSTIAGVPQLDIVTQGDFGATSANDMVVYSMAASPANQQVCVQMRPGIPGTLTAPAVITANGNRTTVQASAGLPASLTLAVRFGVAGTVKFQTAYSWMR